MYGIKRLDREFYNRNSVDIAKDLLGKYLIHILDNVPLVGRIVETEAYMGPHDKAAHSFNNKRTKRTEVMFGPPGFAYVYHIYGMYYCMNVVAAEVNSPQAVLIRALEPIAGLDKMSILRYNKELNECSPKELIGLTNGPGKLCKSMNITKASNKIDLCENIIYIATDEKNLSYKIISTPRVNIDYADEAIHYPWRFFIQENKYVSQK